MGDGNTETMDQRRYDPPLAVRRLWWHLNDVATTYLVGGSVRDILLGVRPHDYDLATSLTPAEVRERCESAGYRVLPTGERFGTVTVLTETEAVEVTTFRVEGRYNSKRQPEVSFTRNLEDDLGRRDFTINAMAMSYDEQLVDPFGGEVDLKAHVLRGVGDPAERFQEDSLRIWRLYRFAATLNGSWAMDIYTRKAAIRYRFLTAKLSPERVRAELTKIVHGQNAEELYLLYLDGLLSIAIPEFAAGIDFDQKNHHHSRTVAEHNVLTARLLPPGKIRLAGLLHDIAKPVTYCLGDDGEYHYYGHDEVGAIMVDNTLRRLTFSNDWIDYVTTMVRRHMFPFWDAGPAAYRRLVADVGEEMAKDLLTLHVADLRAGHMNNIDWEPPARYLETIEGASKAIGEIGQKLALNGNDVMSLLEIKPGPRVGEILNACQEAVFEDPTHNTEEWLTKLVLDWK